MPLFALLQKQAISASVSPMSAARVVEEAMTDAELDKMQSDMKMLGHDDVAAALATLRDLLQDADIDITRPKKRIILEMPAGDPLTMGERDLTKYDALEQFAESIRRECADLREKLKFEATLRLQCANDSQMHLDRALAAEADNAALRAENARLLQLVLAPGTIPFNWQELEAENAALRAECDAKRLTRQQAAIIGAFTGIACGPFSDIHGYVDSLPGFKGIMTHNFASKETSEKIKEAARADFLAICFDAALLAGKKP